MRQLLINSAFTKVKNTTRRLKDITHILLILIFMMMIYGCPSPGPLVPGQTTFSPKDMPLVVFTLELSQFSEYPLIDMVLLDNTTQERQYRQVWSNLTNKQHQQDFYKQIITLQLNPGTYTIEKIIPSKSNYRITIVLNKQFTVKDNTVSYIGNIHIINEGAAESGVEKYVKLALIGREKLYMNISYNDNYDTDIIKIKHMFPCLKDINIENQLMVNK
ncbi:MAG: hypothetical protein WAN11_26495 [Syntrophobacteraceae bacterium]